MMKNENKIKKLCLLRKKLYFFSSDNGFNIEEYNYKSIFLQESQYRKYLSHFEKPPLNLYSKTSQKIEKTSLFSKNTLQKFMLSKEVQEIQKTYHNFLKDLQNFDTKNLSKYLEGNYYNLVIDFMEKFKNSHFYFDLFEPKPLIFDLSFMKNYTVQGVFLERCLNDKQTQYFSKDFFGAKIHNLSGKPSDLLEKNKTKKENLIHDEELLEENIENFRKNYQIQQIYLKIQTNMRLNICEKSVKKLVFGSEDPGLIETRYLQIEHKCDFVNFKPKKFIITDVDNILKGNPHFI